jgi:hypothetical protein
MAKATLPDAYSTDDAARWRDEVIRRMANTPPRPKPSPRTKRKMKAGASIHRAGNRQRSAYSHIWRV